MAGDWFHRLMAAAGIRGGAVRTFTSAWAPRRNQNQCRGKSSGATRRERFVKGPSNWFLAGTQFSWGARTFSLMLAASSSRHENQRLQHDDRVLSEQES